MTIHEIKEQFKNYALDYGVNIQSEIIADGNLHRAKDETGKLNIAYCLHIDGRAAGYFENFRMGIKEKWKLQGEAPKLTDTNRQAFAEKRKAEEIKRKSDDKAKHEAAAKKALYIWGVSTPAISHPYLTRKRIQANSARIGLENTLIVPIFNANNQLVNLQFISSDGVKRFLSGGQKKGCFYWIGKLLNNKILICEGFATAASIFQSTNLLTVVAFDAGNLSPVAETIRANYPKSEIIIMADNDESGIGQQKARAAAIAAGCKYLVCPLIGADFNDYTNMEVMA